IRLAKAAKSRRAAFHLSTVWPSSSKPGITRRPSPTLVRTGANSINITSTEQATRAIQVTHPILQANTEFRATDHLASNFVREAQPSPRHVGYGLPCAKCGTYYMADQSICPVCKCGERISPI